MVTEMVSISHLAAPPYFGFSFPFATPTSFDLFISYLLGLLLFFPLHRRFTIHRQYPSFSSLCPIYTFLTTNPTIVVCVNCLRISFPTALDRSTYLSLSQKACLSILRLHPFTFVPSPLHSQHTTSSCYFQD